MFPFTYYNLQSTSNSFTCDFNILQMQQSSKLGMARFDSLCIFRKITLIWPGLRLQRVSISLSWDIFLGLKVLFCLFCFKFLQYTLRWLPAPLGHTVIISNWQPSDLWLKPCLRVVLSSIQIRSRGRSLFLATRPDYQEDQHLFHLMLSLSPSKSVNESKYTRIGRGGHVTSLAHVACLPCSENHFHMDQLLQHPLDAFCMPRGPAIINGPHFRTPPRSMTLRDWRHWGRAASAGWC